MLMIRDLPVVSRLLSEGSIIVPIRATDKQSLLDTLLETACKSSLVANCIEARKAVLEREKQMSTGVGGGLAIPHARTDAVSGTVAVMGILETPVPYDALDGKDVQLVLLLLGPRNDTSRHIRILSRVSRLMSDDQTRLGLLNATSEQEALDLIEKQEVALVGD